MTQNVTKSNEISYFLFNKFWFKKYVCNEMSRKYHEMSQNVIKNHEILYFACDGSRD